MKAKDKRQEMLDAAAHEFIEHGYAATSLSSVAGRLHLTKGALAHHFPTKDALLDGLGETLSAAIAESERVTLLAYPDNGIQAIITYMLHLGSTAAQNIQVAAALVLLTDRGTPQNVLRELFFEWLDALQLLLRNAQERGEIAENLDLDEVSEFLLATNVGTTLIPSRSGVKENRKKRLRFLRLALTSLGAEDVDGKVDEVLTTQANALVILPPHNPTGGIPGATPRNT